MIYELHDSCKICVIILMLKNLSQVLLKPFLTYFKHVKYYTYWMTEQFSWDMERSTRNNNNMT